MTQTQHLISLAGVRELPIDEQPLRALMIHRSGLNFNVSSAASDSALMKAQVAAGTTHLGESGTRT
jgi:hypothetical protein